ncbi:MAG TPA: PepSY domain-containing protein [Enhygromyxa sp.]|nr:PepSY domain-containing protein [Enhygromyxa sp.]
MPAHPNRRDLRATLFAAAMTLVTVLLNPDPGLEQPAAPGDDESMRGLIDAEQARAEGAWLIDDPDARARLSFAPQYDRLVWRVDGSHADVLLDAQTGEILEFSF